MSATGILISSRITSGPELPQIAANQRGFTLLEMMLVVVLISITVTFVNLNLQPDPKKIVLREGERIAALIRQLKDESILRGRPLALEFDEFDQQYGFTEVQGGEWTPLDGDDIFRMRTIRQPVKATLSIEGVSEAPDEASDESEVDSEKSKAGKSRIIVDPIGAITAFKMTLFAEGSVVNVGLDTFEHIVVTLEEEEQ